MLWKECSAHPALNGLPLSREGLALPSQPQKENASVTRALPSLCLETLASPSPSTAAPAVPARDARRKRTHTLRQAFGMAERADIPRSVGPASPRPSNQLESPVETTSAFSDDEPMQKPKQQPRKLTRPEGNLNLKNRQVGSPMASPSLQQGPFGQPTSPTADHVPYQLQRDVPASAVMF